MSKREEDKNKIDNDEFLETFKDIIDTSEEKNKEINNNDNNNYISNKKNYINNNNNNNINDEFSNPNKGK